MLIQQLPSPIHVTSVHLEMLKSAVGFDGTGNVDLSLSLANSGVSAGTYGSGSQVSQITVDAKGKSLTLLTLLSVHLSKFLVDLDQVVLTS